MEVGFGKGVRDLGPGVLLTWEAPTGVSLHRQQDNFLGESVSSGCEVLPLDMRN